MKPEYGSHKRANLAGNLTEQREAITSNSRPEPNEIPLPGLSVAQTELFYRLRESAAKYKTIVPIAPGGEISVQRDGDRQSHSWGNIHDEDCVGGLITTLIIDGTFTRKEVNSLMFKLFPGSKKLGFLFESKGGN